MAIYVLTSASPPNNCQRTFNRYDLIPLRADVLWKIERGVVRTTTWSEAGRLVTLGYWGSLDVVGQPLSRVEPYQIECLTSVEVSLLPSERWHQALDAILLHIQQSEELLNIVRQEGVQRRLQQMFV
jgi:CRP-like cAMP-binding protein